MKNLFSIFVPLYVANIRIITICSKFFGVYFSSCHMTGQYHQSQALQLTFDSFQKRIFALQITDNSFGKEKNREDSVIVPTHYLLLENLLPNCKVLNINTPKKQKVPKETNWKQKFQKPQNENICLTYLNTEMNGNFHFLSFCAAFLKVQNQVL